VNPITSNEEESRLFLGLEGAGEAGEAEGDVLADLEREVRPRHHRAHLLHALRIGAGAGLALELGLDPPPLLSPQVIQRDVGRDAEKPALEGGFAAEPEISSIARTSVSWSKSSASSRLVTMR
jgi:hypothetical protein